MMSPGKSFSRIAPAGVGERDLHAVHGTDPPGQGHPVDLGDDVAVVLQELLVGAGVGQVSVAGGVVVEPGERRAVDRQVHGVVRQGGSTSMQSPL
jgi:hypothetical protein